MEKGSRFQEEAEAEMQAQNGTERPEQAAESQVQNDTESMTESQDGRQMQKQAQESDLEMTGVDSLDDELLEGG